MGILQWVSDNIDHLGKKTWEFPSGFSTCTCMKQADISNVENFLLVSLGYNIPICFDAGHEKELDNH